MERPPYTKVLGGAVGGVPRTQLPQLIANLLAARDHELKITLRPERLPESAYYTVEWQYLEYDLTRGWQPLSEDDGIE